MNDQGMKKEQIFEILKKAAESTNKQNLISIIKYLENNLYNAKTFKSGDKTKLKLPFCWNCKTNKCDNHK